MNSNIKIHREDMLAADMSYTVKRRGNVVELCKAARNDDYDGALWLQQTICEIQFPGIPFPVAATEDGEWLLVDTEDEDRVHEVIQGWAVASKVRWLLSPREAA